jgi:hypothetical protein
LIGAGWCVPGYFKKRTCSPSKAAASFPYDMLRYNACWPFSEVHDSYKLSPHQRGIRRVILETQKPNAPPSDAGGLSLGGW